MVIFPCLRHDTDLHQVIMRVVVVIVFLAQPILLGLVEPFRAFGRILRQLVDFVEALLRPFLHTRQLIAELRVQVSLDEGHRLCRAGTPIR